MRHLIISILLVLISLSAFSQRDSDSRLALKYYQDKDFDKASKIYERLYNDSQSEVYFTYYIRCLISLEDYENAEKVLKKQIRKKPKNKSYEVQLGNIYKLQGSGEEAAEQFEHAIKKVEHNRNQIVKLGNAFNSIREFSYAEKTYLKGRKVLKGDYTFAYEMANIYFMQRDYQKMIDEYLNLLETNEGYIQNVQNRLQSAVYNDIDNSLQPILKTSLLRRIQKNSSKTIFSELLIWLYIQDKDFKNAFIQAKAIDKRNNENGDRILSLGELALSNGDYNIALDAFSYIIEKGKDSGNYIIAKNEYLSTLLKKITSNSNYSLEDIKNLEKSYSETIEELGENSRTASIIVNQAYLKAFYLDKADEAVDILEKTLLIRGINNKQLSYCKLTLGDVLLLTGDIWSATLYYAQAEKLNANNPIGHEAKFRKSKLAYYSGNFQWAQAQLDILKASTSKLIANDAFELSMLINDNTALDTTLTAMKLYANADLLLFQNKDSLAILSLDSIIDNFKTHSLLDEAKYKKATIYYRACDYDKTALFLNDIIENHSYDILADNATFELAQLYETDLNDIEKAKELYKSIITKYSDSIYVVEARKRYRQLRGDKLDE